MNADDRNPQPSSGRPTADHRPIPHYEIRVDGHLGSRWATRFDGMTLTRDVDGTTVISGPVVDQAALHGVLQKLRDLGICLSSLTQLDPDTEHPTDQPHRNTPGATS